MALLHCKLCQLPVTQGGRDGSLPLLENFRRTLLFFAQCCPLNSHPRVCANAEDEAYEPNLIQ